MPRRGGGGWAAWSSGAAQALGRSAALSQLLASPLSSASVSGQPASAPPPPPSLLLLPPRPLHFYRLDSSTVSHGACAGSLPSCACPPSRARAPPPPARRRSAAGRAGSVPARPLAGQRGSAAAQRWCPLGTRRKVVVCFSSTFPHFTPHPALSITLRMFSPSVPLDQIVLKAISFSFMQGHFVTWFPSVS
ncbi:CASP-like protein 4A2 [Piliocolobus tephrosceles]|uniref:CASP-like protein 4A2 n=1 Tax=Piliocolobus tephrosceles TaxID=591936 RepID=UPI000C2AC22A|nr:CASP-like protein 4A2 [Piliocolobus tephrosceles]